MKWREVISIVLRKCKWRIILSIVLLAVPLLVNTVAIAKPKTTITPLDPSDSGKYPNPNIDPL